MLPVLRYSRRLVPALPLLLRLSIASATMGNQASAKGSDPVYKVKDAPQPKVTFPEEELRSRLTSEQYRVTQLKGTERPFTGEHLEVTDNGVFRCVVCGNELFKTDKKFESGTGWPSFSDVAKRGNVVQIVDDSLGMVRTEVVCGNCGAHLGHIFDDGPREDTGLRYCINSAALKFDPEKGGASGSTKKEEEEEGGAGTKSEL